MKKIEASMAEAIREGIRDPGFRGVLWVAGNTVVSNTTGRLPYTEVCTEVTLYSTTIAQFDRYPALTLYAGEYRTRLTQSRLNAILAVFGDGYYIKSYKGEWWLCRGGYRERKFVDGIGVRYSLA